MNKAMIQSQIAACRARFVKDPENNAACKITWNKNQGYAKSLLRHSHKDCPASSVAYLQTPCVIRKFEKPSMTLVAGSNQKKGETRLTNQGKRALAGLMTTSIAVFVYLFVVIYIDYIKQVQKNEFIDFDVKTITAGDYSIEFDIDHEIYDKWKAHYLKGDNPMSEMAQFKLYIQTKLEERISAMDDLGYEGPLPEGQHYRKIKIAQITFAFYNEKIINKLRKRGALIKTEKWDKLLEIND
jgi:hypothetical protein